MTASPIIQVDLTDSEFNYIEILPTGDWHVGSMLTAESELAETLEYIKNVKHAYTILVGDLINNNLRNSVGLPFEDFIPPSKQKKRVEGFLAPLAEQGKILLATGGNHEARTRREADLDITEDICDRLDIPYTGDDGIVHIKTRQADYVIFATHSAGGGGKRPGGKLNSVELLSLNVQADIFVVGHYHTVMAYKARVRVPNLTAGIEEFREQLYVTTGAFQDYPHGNHNIGYAKSKQFRPQALGVAKIVLSTNRKDFYTII